MFEAVIVELEFESVGVEPVFACEVSQVVGSAFCAAGSVTGFAAFAVVGASLVTVGGGLANICVGLSCVGLSARTSGIVVAWAYVVSFALRWVFGALPVWANLAFFACIPLVSMALCRKRLFSICGKLQHKSPAEISIASPSSFVPFGHQLFISLVVFRFVYGYFLTFGEANRVPVVAFRRLCLCVSLRFLWSRAGAPFRPMGFPRVSSFFGGGFSCPFCRKRLARRRGECVAYCRHGRV